MELRWWIQEQWARIFRNSKQIQLWWEAGVVEKAPQEAKCNFALLMVPKKDENGVEVDKRLCLDLSPINNKLSVDHYPIPNLFECLKIGGKFKGEDSRRSVVDYTSSFTRFVCRNNIACFEFEGTRYTFTRAMFGSRIMPAIFQRIIDAIILESGLEVQAYLDDALIGGHTKEECIVNTVKFIEISTKYKLIINQKKSKFVKKSVTILGYIQNGEGIKIHPSKVKAIVDWERPTTGKEVRSFMGTANWPRKLVKDIAIIGAPLDRLRMAHKVEWNDVLEKSFNGVKKAIVEAVTAVTEREGATVLVGTDASIEGLGFWRGQAKAKFEDIPPEELTEDQIEIIEFGSKAIALDEPLRHAGATTRELMAVIFAFKKMYKHLLGRQFVLFSDHSALVHVCTKEPRSPLVLRWMDILMSLSFSVVHWPGAKNAIADALLRRSCIPKEFEHLKPKELHTIEMIEELVTGKVAPETEEERSRLIIAEHEKGHFGADQMFKQLWTRNIHWKGIREDIKKTVGKCEPCLRFVTTQEGFHPYTPITEMWPMKRTTIDLIVNVPTSKAGFRHIMVYMCLATRFVWLKALKNKTMEAVMTELLKIHRYFGKPLVINSDNGKEFVNQFTERLVALDEVEWRTI
jgi:hypothetical protein